MGNRSLDLYRASYVAPSKQGLNVAFIGLDHAGKIACAEYMRRKLSFKRMELREGLVHFLRTSRGYHSHFKMGLDEIMRYYDAIYKLDNDLFLEHFKRRFNKVENDVVVSDIRYLNELRALQELGFIIVRVTVPHGSLVSRKVGNAATDTVILSILYDREFANNYNVDYNVEYTSISRLEALINPILEQNGYKFDKAT